MFTVVHVHSITATQSPYLWDFDVTAIIGGVEMRIPFTYSGTDIDGLSPAVGQWWAENPDAEVLPYVAPVLDPYTPLAPYQFRAMLDLSGKSAALAAFINSLPQPNQTIARNKLEYSLVFLFDNDLVQAARQGLAIPMQEFQALWLQATLIK